MIYIIELVQTGVVGQLKISQAEPPPEVDNNFEAKPSSPLPHPSTYIQPTRCLTSLAVDPERSNSPTYDMTRGNQVRRCRPPPPKTLPS